MVRQFVLLWLWLCAAASLNLQGDPVTPQTQQQIDAWVALGSFTTLDLSNQGLTGGLPDSIGTYTSLESINLGGNTFTGSIPGSWLQLGNLTSLLLGGNSIVPSSVNQLGNLQVLDLSSNGLKTFPKIFNLSRLTTLDLSMNALSGSLPEEVGQLRALRSLKLANNNLNGPLPAALAQCSQLRLLDVNHNTFNGSVPAALSTCSQLEILDLSANLLSGPFPSTLTQLRNLTVLKLGFNSLSGTLPQDLSAWSQLLLLDVTTNFLQGPLPPRIGLDLPQVSVLNLGKNQFSGSLPPSLGNLACLTRLDVSRNNLSGVLPKQLGQLFPPRLDRCPLRCDDPCPRPWSTDQVALYLDLSANRLSGTLPAELGMMGDPSRWAQDPSQWASVLPGLLAAPPVLYLRLSSNNFTGALPPSVGNLRYLYLLELSSNQLSGPLPDSLGNLTHLERLYLSGNALSGPIPSGLNALPSLSSLFLDQNQLSGPIPDLPGSFPSLGNLDLSGNRLTGPLPSFLQKHGFLVYLNFSSNLLSGPVSPAIFASARLRKVDLSQNQLNGTLDDPGDCALTSLDLSSNRLTGAVPGISARQLTSLLLSGNAFSSVTPGTPVRGLVLTRLDLSNNQLRSWPLADVVPRGLVSQEGTASSTLDCVRVQALVRSPDFGSTLGSFLGLKYLDLSGNPLQLGAREVLFSLYQMEQLQFFGCARCQLTGELPGFYYFTKLQDECGAARGAAATVTQILPALQTLDLSKNNITAVGDAPPANILSADLSNNLLGQNGGGLSIAWFNAYRRSTLTTLAVTGNPALQISGVQGPASCGSMAALVAQADQFAGVAPGVECTLLCSSPIIVFADRGLDPKAMCRCLPGWGGSARNCTPCPPDTYSVSLDPVFGMVKVCRPCPLGTSTRGLTQALQMDQCKCPVGSYLNLTSAACVRCDFLYPLRTTLVDGQTSSAACRCVTTVPGLQVKADRAQKDDGSECSCPEQTFLHWKAMECRACGSGQQCPASVEPPLIQRGFWAATASCGGNRSSCPEFQGHSVFRCYSRDTCLENGACAEGRTGPACSLCLPGRYGGPNGACRPCSTSVEGAWGSLISIMVPVVIALTLLLNAFLKLSESAFSSSELLRKFKEVLGDSVKGACMEMYQHIQLMSVVAWYQVYWPPEVADFLSLISSIATQVFDISGTGCLAQQQSAGLQLGFRWLFPLACAGVAMLTPLVAQPLAWVGGRLLSGRWARACSYLAMSFSDAFKVVVWLVVLFFTTLLQCGLQLVTCVPNPNGVYTVRAFPHLQCPGAQGASQEWLVLIGPCMVYLAVVVVAIPSLLWYVWRSMVHYVVETNMKSRGPWGFLTVALRTSHLHWLFASMLKRLLINLVQAAISSNATLQLLITCFITAVYAVITLWESPYRDPAQTLAEAWTSSCLSAFSALGASGLQMDTGKVPQPGDWRGGVMLALQIAGVAGPFVIYGFAAALRLRCTARYVPASWRPRTSEEEEVALEELRVSLSKAARKEVLQKLDAVDKMSLEKILSTSVAFVGEVELSAARGGLTATRLRSTLKRLATVRALGASPARPLSSLAKIEDEGEGDEVTALQLEKDDHKDEEAPSEEKKKKSSKKGERVSFAPSEPMTPVLPGVVGT